MVVKKRNNKWTLCIVLLLVIYGVFLFWDRLNDQGEMPEIHFVSENLEISVNDGKDALLKGVSASDEEDGDLSDEIVIDSLSAFDADNNRVVTYAVFDSDRNVTKATRLIHYSDYTKPKFSLTGSFASNTLNVTNITNLIKASSCVDGDISSRISVEAKSSSKNDIINFVVSVSDSTGETSTLELEYNYDTNNYTTDIELHRYLVYLNRNDVFSAYDNIAEVNTRSVSADKVSAYMNITDNVDTSTPGVYEITYTFNYYGDYGFAKCIVVVE